MRKQFIKIGSSIYGRAVILILSMSIIFFIFLAFLLMSFNQRYVSHILQGCGNRVSVIVNHALNQSMLLNDNTELLELMHSISEMEDIAGINIYNNSGELRHTSYGSPTQAILQPGRSLCSNCHADQDPGKLSDETHCAYSSRIDGEHILTTLSPILNNPSCSSSDCHIHSPDEEILGLQEVHMSLSEVDKELTRSIYDYFLLVSLFLSIIVLILLYFTKRSIHKPLERIVDASRRVAEGNMSIRLPEESFKLADMKQVGRALNDMLEEIAAANSQQMKWSHELESKVQERTEDLQRAQSELVQIERMASLGKLSSAVAHEINNPLAGVLTYTKLVSRKLKHRAAYGEHYGDLLDHLSMIEKETKRCGEIVRGLLDFSRGDQVAAEICSVNKILDETAMLMHHSFEIAEVNFSVDFQAPNDRIICNANQIKQACIAVLVNAMESCDAEGAVSFTSLNNENDEFVIQIEDNGIGIAAGDISHIFEPFFSRKLDTSGTGLGLAVTYGIIQRHKGRIQVDSVLGKGSTFLFILPLHVEMEVRDAKSLINSRS